MITNRSELAKKLGKGAVPLSEVAKNLYPTLERWMLKNDVTIIDGSLVLVV